MFITPQNLIETINNFEEFAPKINFPKKIFHYGLLSMHLWLFFVGFFFSGLFTVLSITFVLIFLFYFHLYKKIWRKYNLSTIKLRLLLIFTFFPTMLIGIYIRNSILSFIF